MNHSDLSRREQVLKALQDANGAWVDGPDLANAEVGGSEGLKRLRELREQDGWDIRKRKHPDPNRDIYQYRLAPVPTATGVGEAWAFDHAVYMDPSGRVFDPVADGPVEPAEKPDYQPQRRHQAHLGKTASGQYVVVGAPPPEVADLEDEEMPPPEPPVAEGQMDMGVPEEAGIMFTSMPTVLELGKTVPCPRCRGYRRPIKERDPVTKKVIKGGKIIAYEDYCRDPYKPTQTCPRCNGFGVVPR